MKTKTHCEYCGAKKITPEEKARLAKRFVETNESGAARFTTDWIGVNDAAVQAAIHLGIDSSDLRTKALLTEACYRILARLRSSRKG